MEEWQKRVIEERNQLVEKLTKLKAFLDKQEEGGGSDFVGTPQWNSMVGQEGCMEGYRDALDRRIELFTS